MNDKIEFNEYKDPAYWLKRRAIRATVTMAEYQAIKKKLDICQKECIRIAELYKHDKQLFNSKIQRIIRHIEEFKRGVK